MKSVYGRFTFLLLILLMLVSACSPNPSAENTDAAPLGQGQNTAAPANTATTAPTATPTVQPTSSLSQDELKAKWRAPIGSYALLAGICQSTQETVQKKEKGEIDDAKLSGEVFGIRLILGITKQALEQWAPEAGAEAYKTKVTEHLVDINLLVEQWSGGNKTTDVMATELTTACDTINKEVQDMVAAAKGEGMSQATFEALGKEIQESMTASTTTQTEPTIEPTVPAGPGMSRQNPSPAGSVVAATNWEVQVLEAKRGDEAWQMIQAANQFNEPAPEGMEYLLARIKAKNISTQTDELNISRSDFELTGSSHIEYSAPSIVAPEPVLDAKLFQNGEAEGWVPLIAAKGETNLILIFDEVFSFEEGGLRFVALDEGASVTALAELSRIQPNDLGMERANPAPKGQTVVTDDWELTVGDVVRGEEAWQQILAGNQFNDPPADGMEYALVKVKVHYIGSSNTAVAISAGDFKSTGSANVMHDHPSIVPPEPTLDAHLFPGGQAEGWVPALVKQGETGLQIVFSPMFDWSDTNRRFMAVEP